MTCSLDLKEYVFEEGPAAERARVEAHAAGCTACRDEIARLRLTQTSLLAVRDEEPPRRIAFVSDKVFEPRWYQRVWNSGPQLGFAAAALLACAILIHSYRAPAPAPQTAVVQVDTTVIEREVSARVTAAVTKAVADSEARQQKRTVELLQAAGQRYEFDRRATIAAFSEQTRLLQKQVANMYVTANNLRAGE